MKIFENFLPQKAADDIENTMKGTGFPWYYIPDVTREKFDSSAYAQPGFHHTPFMNYQPKSPFFDYFKLLACAVEDAIEWDDPLHLFRIRAGLNVANAPSNKRFSQDYNFPHVDQNADIVKCQTFTCLYYVNDSDGDTHIFNEDKESEKYTIKHQVSPIKNRMMYFDGKQYHASSSPIASDVRIALTFNFHAERIF